MSTRIQIRRDTAAAWASSNPTLAAGEIGIDTTVDRFKIGDGATAWASLGWAHATDAQGTLADGAAQKSANLSDLADAATARTNLGMTAAGQALATAASAAVQRAALALAPRTRTVWTLGDSLTVGNLAYDSGVFASLGQPCIQYNPGAWPTWALLNSEARWTFGGHFATAGYSAAQILATHVPSVIAAAAAGDTVVVLAGTNGYVIGDVQAIHAALHAAGLHSVVVSVPPSTPAGINTVGNFNAGLARYAAGANLPYADIHSAVVDRATGAYQAALDSDGVHPNAAGFRVFGETIAATLNPLWASAVPLADHNLALTAAPYTNPLCLDEVTDETDYKALSALGTSTIDKAANAAFVGGYGYKMTRGDTDIMVYLSTAKTLVAGHRYRFGFAWQGTAGSGSYGMRTESNTTGGAQLIGMGYGQPFTTNSGPGRWYIEFTCPTLPDYSYRMPRIGVSGAGAILELGECTFQDLTAMGAA